MEHPSRKSIRLKTWNYAARAYYHVTVCTNERNPLLSAVIKDESNLEQPYDVSLTRVGQYVEEALRQASDRYPSVSVENWVVMPNHVHLLVGFLEEDVSLSRFISFWKSAATRLARQVNPDLKLWQRGYYEHILRGEEDYHAVWQYIENNPAKWANDEYHVSGA